MLVIGHRGAAGEIAGAAIADTGGGCDGWDDWFVISGSAVSVARGAALGTSVEDSVGAGVLGVVFGGIVSGLPTSTPSWAVSLGLLSGGAEGAGDGCCPKRSTVTTISFGSASS